MKILHLEASPGWGGQEIRILKESIGIREKGHEVVLCSEKNAKLAFFAKKNHFKVYELNFKKSSWPYSLLLLLKIIKKEKVDLINTHSSLDAWLGGIAARLSKTKVIRTRHLSTPIRKGLNSRILYHYLTDFVVTTCKAIVPIIVKQSGKPPHLCKSIPTGVNFKEIIFSKDEPDRFRKQIGIQKSDFLVGMVCFMRSWKGVHDFLKAADLLREEQDIKWVIIGGGHESEYREEAKKLNLNHLTFTGHLDKPYAAIQALDVFSLLSTNHEGVSQASLQAAFLERPLITTKTGGLPEVCVHEKTGFQVSSFYPKEVAKNVLLLKNDAALRKKMGEQGKKLVLESFTFEKTLLDMESTYQKLHST